MASTSLYQQIISVINTYPDDDIISTTEEALEYLGLS